MTTISSRKPTVSLDFDATLHPYTDGWVGSHPTDEPPTPGAEEFCQRAVARGFRLVVSSCRADHEEGKRGIVIWLEKYGLLRYVSEVTHLKPVAVAYVDDRSVVFRGSWGDVLTDVESLSSKQGAPPAARR